LPRRSSSLTALALAGAFALAACKPAPDGNEADNKAGAAATPAREPKMSDALPLPTPALDREGLLRRVAEAASASAGGVDDRTAQSELDGRQLTLLIRFGCGGPTPDAAARSMSWSYDEETQALKVRATPDLSQAQPVIGAIAGETFEAAEGFWLARPWLFADACPAGQSGANAQGAPTAEGPRPGAVGIAHFFTASDSRVSRRSARSFETVQKLDGESVPAGAGFNLVLSGRLKAFPDGRVIRCVPTDPNARPICVVSAELSRVSLQNAESGASMAEWGVG
jgi:hypothetical protein